MKILFLFVFIIPSIIIAFPQESGKVWENPCGILPAEIFPEQVEPYHMPWLVRVGYEKKGRMHYSCAGSLIDRNHILTAASCVSSGRTPTRIQLRNCDDSKLRCVGLPKNYGVQAIFSHPEFKSLSLSYDHDIAVVRLDRDVNLSVGGTKAVCLPIDEPFHMIPDDTEFIVGGWRIHENGTKYTPGNGPPRTVSVPPVSLEECQELYNDAIKLTQDIQICAGGEGNEPCRGDAGAPLHTIVGKRLYQIGLASFGLPGCSNGSLPTVYTTIRPHLEWIQEAVNTST